MRRQQRPTHDIGSASRWRALGNTPSPIKSIQGASQLSSTRPRRRPLRAGNFVPDCAHPPVCSDPTGDLARGVHTGTGSAAVAAANGMGSVPGASTKTRKAPGTRKKESLCSIGGVSAHSLHVFDLPLFELFLTIVNGKTRRQDEDGEAAPLEAKAAQSCFEDVDRPACKRTKKRLVNAFVRSPRHRASAKRRVTARPFADSLYFCHPFIRIKQTQARPWNPRPAVSCVPTVRKRRTQYRVQRTVVNGCILIRRPVVPLRPQTVALNDGWWLHGSKSESRGFLNGTSD